ncbi:MAG: 50S ribosomal protein L5 [Sedimentisphaerales bacterium]|nr:50S ribosomal protein L5 [Sedimentisphaerales bacterium]
MVRLKQLYKQNIIQSMTETFKYKNVMQVPRLEKIIVSMGLGKAIQDKKVMESALKELAQVTGQKAVVCKARKSVSNFKLREGMDIGAKVTLRRERMYEFLDRLVSLAIPRVRDFRGLSPRGFDGRGNYNMGLTEQSVFPEIDAAKVEQTRGMNITIVTTAHTDEEGRELLKRFGMPFAGMTSETN